MSTRELLYNAISEMTDEQVNAIYTVIRFMLVSKPDEQKNIKAQNAYETIARLRKPYTTVTDDDKEEYYQYLEDKYENLG